MPEISDNIREKVIEMYQQKGVEFLQKEVKEKDPVFYNEVDKNNPQRLMRALEVIYSTNKTFSSFRKGTNKKRNFKIIKIGLHTDRKILYNRINSRVELMINNGLLKEVESLIPYKNKNSLKTVGYKELFQYFEGIYTLTEAVEKIKQNTRRFAKRQITWFKKDPKINRFSPEDTQEIIDFIG